MSTETTTRLHITPFSPELFNSVLPPSVRPSATDISYHAIPTFPEKNYGYVTLPTMEAEKIKKKLHGSILKGRKFKVEVARPLKRHMSDYEDAASEPKHVREKKSKNQKAAEGVIEGHELPSDRHVKRGWTESTSAKKERRTIEKKKGKDEKKAKTQPKSKYTEKAECLFRTNVPPNRSSVANTDEKESRKKKKKKSLHETVVHEFSKTVTHPSFLRSGDDGKTPTTEFVEGRGWVDESGNVKEPASDRIRKNEYRPGQVPGAKEKWKSKKAPQPEKEPESQGGKKKGVTAKESVSTDSSDQSEDWTSSSGSSSSNDTSDSEDESGESISSSSSDESSVSAPQKEAPEFRKDTGKVSSSPAPALTATDTVVRTDEDSEETSEHTAEENNEESPEKIHPLEALFKRPPPETSDNKSPPEASTQFSFFGQDDIESDEEEDVQAAAEPQTPFTKKDLQIRGLRSAAPTPDTALVNRKVTWNDSDEMDVSEDAEDIEPHSNTPISKSDASALGKEKVETEFAKWFWEHRGENNRAWKRRRREAAKEQRQRENRRKGLKGKS